MKKSRSFTPEEAESTFSCHQCREVVLRPENPVPFKVVDSIRRIGLLCKFCQVTSKDSFLGPTIDAATGETWTPEYREYMCSSTWRTLRRLAIDNAGGRCQMCNSDLLLQVHHRRYPKVLGWESLSDLTVLCRRCHDQFHNLSVREAK